MSRFIDEVELIVRSGNGGAGAVSFRREKYVPKGGPDGGDGGNGGDVIFKVKRDLRSLYDLKLKRIYKAMNGFPGSGRNKKGSKGEDCTIHVPPGTVILNGKSKDLLIDFADSDGETTLLKGGQGGLGNAHFATSTNRAPRYAQKGSTGKELALIVQVKTIADVGIVGLPNAGKSTLLSVLTDARPEVADYPFTTISPNLGVMNYKDIRQFIIADIPGLIEGASNGHGLGIQFLKHIERTKILVILIDLFNGDFNKQYETLLKEMSSYSKRLLEKPRLIVGSKKDLIQDKQASLFLSMQIPGIEIPEIKISEIKISGKKLCISSVSGDGLNVLKEEIAKLLENLNEKCLS